jgi:cell division protein FtsL
MSEKMVKRSVAVALGMICIILIAIIAYFTITGISAQNSYNDLQNQVNNLQSWLSGNKTYYQNQILSQNSIISSQNATIRGLQGQVTNLQNQVNNFTKILNQTKPYIYSQLLHYPTTNIPAHTGTSGWVLNWTPTMDIRVIRIQVWMGNPSNITWEGDTFVTIGKPANPWNSISYNNTIQLLVHYQFDSHAQSNAPTEIMFDLTPGFKVASGQTIYVFRLFNNISSTQTASGDVEVIIYYENI